MRVGPSDDASSMTSRRRRGCGNGDDDGDGGVGTTGGTLPPPTRPRPPPPPPTDAALLPASSPRGRDDEDDEDGDVGGDAGGDEGNEGGTRSGRRLRAILRPRKFSVILPAPSTVGAVVALCFVIVVALFLVGGGGRPGSMMGIRDSFFGSTGGEETNEAAAGQQRDGGIIIAGFESFATSSTNPLGNGRRTMPRRGRRLLDGGGGGAGFGGGGGLNLRQYTLPSLQREDEERHAAAQMQHQHQRQRQQAANEHALLATLRQGAAESSSLAEEQEREGKASVVGKEQRGQKSGRRRLFYCGASWEEVNAAKAEKKKKAPTMVMQQRSKEDNRTTTQTQSTVTGTTVRYNLLGVKVAKLLFPRLLRESPTPIPLTRHNLPNATGDDVLVFLMHQYCHVQDAATSFPGRQLHVNSEFYDLHPNHPINRRHNRTLTLNYLPPNPNVYTLGTHGDVPRKSIRVTFLQLLLATRPPDVRELIFDHRKKPRNTMEHFLIYANSHHIPYRERAALALSDIGVIHTAGKCQGNVPPPDDGGAAIDESSSAWGEEGYDDDGHGHRKKLTHEICTPHHPEGTRPGNIRPLPQNATPGGFSLGANRDLMSKYRFALVMENTNCRGYVTEKILTAFLAGSVPIYHGTREVFDMFNPDAFVYYDPANPGVALDRVRMLEGDRTAYEAVLRQPILRDGERTIERYFSLQDGVGGGRLKRRIWDMMGYDE